MNTLSISHGRPLFRCLLGLGMLLGTVNASRSQPAVLVTPAAKVAPIDLSGSWSGYWQDCKSGHSGKLWAEFCKCDDTHYRVTFTGRFFKVFPFRYTVVLNVVDQKATGLDSSWLKHLLPYIEQKEIPAAEPSVWLSGQNDLGLLFGTFTYQAEATAKDFVATFSSCRYQGKFVLSRCCCP